MEMYGWVICLGVIGQEVVIGQGVTGPGVIGQRVIGPESYWLGGHCPGGYWPDTMGKVHPFSSFVVEFGFCGLCMLSTAGSFSSLCRRSNVGLWSELNQ